ncbi:hypothetical protein GQ457_01G014130 [Hibiscus cannabinus]
MVKTFIFPDLEDGRVPSYLSRAGQSPHLFRIAGPVSSWPSIAGPVLSWPSSVDKVKTFIFPTSRMEECRVILAEQDNLLTFSELQDQCHLGLRVLIGLRHLFFPTSRMEACRVILAEQDNLLTFLELQDRCHLGLQRVEQVVNLGNSSPSVVMGVNNNDTRSGVPHRVSIPTGNAKGNGRGAEKVVVLPMVEGQQVSVVEHSSFGR